MAEDPEEPQSSSSSGSQALIAVGKVLVGAPAAVIANTVKVIGRLLGSAGAIPEAWIRGKAQGIKDQADARSAIVKAVSKAAAKEAGGDAAIVQRGLEKWAGDLVVRQENREAVGTLILEETQHLQSEAVEGSGMDEAAIDDDWLNIYTKYAEDASTERMRRLWARIAAGEARKPGAFSLASLRLVSELDQQTAAEFGRAFSYATGDVIPLDETWNQGELYTLSLRMVAAGLFMNAPAQVHRNVKILEQGFGIFVGARSLLTIYGTPGTSVRVPVICLSRQGIELASLLEPADEGANLVKLVESMNKDGVARIELAAIAHGRVGDAITLWAKPVET